jgi:membrane protein DedA with SNARE-associated domain
VVTLGNLGFPAGLEIMIPTAGGLAAQGQLPPLGPFPGWVVVGAVGVIGEMLGTSILYGIGYYGGLPFVRRYGKYVHFKEHEFERVHTFFEKYGRLTVFWCRFVPFVRGVVSLPAGISRMPKRFFLGYTFAGSALFCFGLAYLGQYAGKRLDSILPVIHKFGLLIILASIVLAVGAFIYWRTNRGRRPASVSH